MLNGTVREERKLEAVQEKGMRIDIVKEANIIYIFGRLT
jgi:hypothetical protein